MGEGLHVDEPRVLMVDDEKQVADAYALRLQDVADVTVAYGGDEALAIVAEGRPPDVVLLDRHMPGLSGDSVLDELRERDLTTRVIMVTAIDPGFGIADMPFDDYLCKPIAKEDLFAAVDQQLDAASYDDPLTEFFSLTAKLAVLESERSPEQLEAASEYVRMRRRSDELREELAVSTENFEEMVETFTAISRGG